MRYPSEVLRHLAVSVGASLTLALAGLAALVYAVAGTAPPSTAALVFAAFALPAGLGMAWVSSRWYRRAVRCVSAGSAVPATAVLVFTSDMDSNALHAEVVAPGDGRGAPLRLAVHPPAWEFRAQLGQAQQVGLHLDPVARRVVAVSTPQGLLWCYPNNLEASGFAPG